MITGFQNRTKKTVTGLQSVSADSIKISVYDKILKADSDGYITEITDSSGYLVSNGAGTFSFLSTIDIGDINFSLNPNIVVVTNGSGDLTNSSISTTVLGYISGLTSDVQVQITNDEYDISSNTSLIIINIGNIAANATNITTNATNITSNTSNITVTIDETSIQSIRGINDIMLCCNV